jgi:hypothetical protein
VTLIAVAGFVVGVGQLLVGILALRADSAPSGSPAGGLASNRDALNALLVAATCTTIAAVALARVQDSNDNHRKSVIALTSFQHSVNIGQVMSPGVAHIVVAVGLVAALGALRFAQRAWQGWSGEHAQARGVALAASSAIAAGALTVNLLAAITPGA